MTFAEFRRSLTQSKPPTGLLPPLAALWWAGKGQWDNAHQIVMDEDDQAQRPVPDGPLPTEWVAITKTLLERRP